MTTDSDDETPAELQHVLDMVRRLFRTRPNEGLTGAAVIEALPLLSETWVWVALGWLTAEQCLSIEGGYRADVLARKQVWRLVK